MTHCSYWATTKLAVLAYSVLAGLCTRTYCADKDKQCQHEIGGRVAVDGLFKPTWAADQGTVG